MVPVLDAEGGSGAPREAEAPGFNGALVLVLEAERAELCPRTRGRAARRSRAPTIFYAG